MKSYHTISLQATPSGHVEVYDFKTNAATYTVKMSLAGAINSYNAHGYYITAIDRVPADTVKDNRVIIMTAEVML